MIINHFTSVQGCNRKIVLKGQSHFPDFFQMLFLGRKFPFWLTQNKFQWFLKVKSKKKKKKKKRKKERKRMSFPHFVTFPPYIFKFPPSLFQFSFFFPHFPFFFPCLSFPDRSAEISWSEVSGGQSSPLPVTPLLLSVCRTKHLLYRN